MRLESETGRARHVAPLACGLQSFERSLRGVPGKRILLASWYGAGNLGDKLLMCSALERMPGEISRLTTVLLGGVTLLVYVASLLVCAAFLLLETVCTHFACSCGKSR